MLAVELKTADFSNPFFRIDLMIIMYLSAMAPNGNLAPGAKQKPGYLNSAPIF